MRDQHKKKTIQNYILIRDTRDAGGPNAVQVIGAYMGAKEPLKKATAENRVKLTIYDWQCVQHCGTVQHP